MDYDALMKAWINELKEFNEDSTTPVEETEARRILEEWLQEVEEDQGTDNDGIKELQASLGVASEECCFVIPENVNALLEIFGFSPRLETVDYDTHSLI